MKTDVMAADAEGDAARSICMLEEVRDTLDDPELLSMLVERYLLLPPDDAEAALRSWWEERHDRFGGAGLAKLLSSQSRKEEARTVLLDSQGREAWPEYWYLLAGVHKEQGQLDEAVAALEFYARLAPENVEAWLMLADLQQHLGQTERALSSLRHAGDGAPDRILPRMLRVRLLAEMGRWREVRDLAEALLEGKYEDADADLWHDLQDLLARASCALGNSDAARAVWLNLLEQRPENREVRFRLASLELAARRYRCALAALDGDPAPTTDMRALDVQLRCLLQLREYDEAEQTAQRIEQLDIGFQIMPLVRAMQAIDLKEYEWALEQLQAKAPERFRDLWFDLTLDSLLHLGRWQEMASVLKLADRPDQRVLIRAALASMALGKLELTQRLLACFEDQQTPEVRSLNALLAPVRKAQRTVEARRQHQVDEAEKQRWSAESRDLRRRIRDLEHNNVALANALAGSEAALERLLELVGVSTQVGVPVDWESQIHQIEERAHKDALKHELRQAEQRLSQMLGNTCWQRLSEHARSALREGEWLFFALEGADRDYGAALLEYARGLERAFKDVIFVAARSEWELRPGPLDRLQDEGHDPSLTPFVRYVLQGSHLTLGSMAMALDRMSDIRRQGVAVRLLRRQLGIDSWDERSLADWKRTADRLALAAEARNQPAHASAVSREAVAEFRDLVMGTDGLLRALDSA